MIPPERQPGFAALPECKVYFASRKSQEAGTSYQDLQSKLCTPERQPDQTTSD